jgi:hypothetical protein
MKGGQWLNSTAAHTCQLPLNDVPDDLNTCND